MMRFAAALLLLAACTSTADMPLDTPFTLKHGETRGPVTFVDVSDSRCPRKTLVDDSVFPSIPQNSVFHGLTISRTRAEVP